MRRVLPIPILIAVAAIVIALASGGSSTAHKAAPAGAQPAGSATLALRTTPLGKVLVDDRGRTLYLFEADKPGRSACSGACLSIWPAATASARPTAGAGVAAAKVGTIPAGGGQRQVTYNGHPLYTYVGDRAPGDTAGQGLDQFGAEWYVLAAGGDKIDHG